jgi:CelD/BcsL family acetyltransferase involved in cellulose biosynthesis
MAVFAFNPLQDQRWGAFVQGHPSSSVFHTTSWIEALQRTYGYEPVVYTTSPPDARLTNGVLACRVRSWLTGRRLVSVPFADHCQPLLDVPGQRTELARALCDAAADMHGYVELRPLAEDTEGWSAFEAAQAFWFHRLDLRPPLERLYANFHESSIRRKIARAEREGVEYRTGRSDDLLDAFYRLMVVTRRRHGLPPQPRRWFVHLVRAFGDRVTIHVAFVGRRAAGSLLTLSHRNTLVYKYGCSDAALHASGIMPFLFWKTMQEARAAGLTDFDLGRTDRDNPGLLQFKERLGGIRSPLIYIRHGARRRSSPRFVRVPPALMAKMPTRLLEMAGTVLYPHLG